jgi:ArsR family transcriptional regulator
MKAQDVSNVEGTAATVPEAEIGDQISTMFRAFSDQTRLPILHLLVRGEICVGNIVEILQLPQSAVSRHLAYLRRADLVQVRKSGLWAYYSLARVRSPFQGKLYECLKECFCEVPELKEDARRIAELTKNGGCCCPIDSASGS